MGNVQEAVFGQILHILHLFLVRWVYFERTELILVF